MRRSREFFRAGDLVLGALNAFAGHLIIYTPEPDRNRAYAYLNSFEAVRSMLTELMTYDPRDK